MIVGFALKFLRYLQVFLWIAQWWEHLPDFVSYVD